MRPIYLIYLVPKTETLIEISEHIFRLYDFSTEINLLFLKKKIVKTSGERDVVKRSAGAFIGTLVAFGVVDDSNNKLILQQKLFLNEEQACVILKLFALDVLHSPQVSLSDLPKILLIFLKFLIYEQLLKNTMECTGIINIESVEIFLHSIETQRFIRVRKQF